MDCENCNKKHNGDYGSGRFCSMGCSKSYSTKENRSEINEKIRKTLISKESFKIKKCASCCDVIKRGKKKYCGDCKTFSGYLVMFEKLGVCGLSLKESNVKSLEILKKLYFDDEYSLPMIKNKYGIQLNTIYNFFNKNGISLRDNADAGFIAYKNNRLSPGTQSVYKSGWYTTWDGKSVYLRSSYEYNYAEYLDDNKIYYDVEKIRIEYFDSTKNKKRIAIPDFHLIESNTIVEIKSTYTLNIKRMDDKISKYKEHGYNVILVVDGISYDK